MSGMNQDCAERAPDQDDSVNAGSAPPKNRWLKALLLAFCCWHAVFLIISITPGPPGWEDPGHTTLGLYRLLLGGQQQWNMFFTIPVQHSVDVWFERPDGKGGKTIAGCVLPGFKPYPKPVKLRYYALFYQLIFVSKDIPYRDAYLRKAAALLPVPEGSAAGADWSLVVDTQYTRNLFYARRGGQLSVPFVKTFDVNNPGGDSP